MWFWFHSGWIAILPLAMIVLCILMCVLMRRHMFGGCAGCCSRGHSESAAENERKPESDSHGSTR